MNSYLSWQWQPLAGEFGILPMVAGSFLLALSATAVATLWALGLSYWLSGDAAPRPVQKLIRSIVYMMSTVPTVVIALIALFTLIPLIQSVSDASGYSFLASALCLACLILPGMLQFLDEALARAALSLEPLASSLGFTAMQRFLWLFLPAVLPGLGVAVLLGFTRAISDTMIALMLSGNSPRLPHSLLDSFRALTAHIALVVSTDAFSASYASLYPCALLLFLTSLACQLAMRVLLRRLAYD